MNQGVAPITRRMMKYNAKTVRTELIQFENRFSRAHLIAPDCDGGGGEGGICS